MTTIAQSDAPRPIRIPAGIADGMLVVLLTLVIVLLWSAGVGAPDLTGPMRPYLPGAPDVGITYA